MFMYVCFERACNILFMSVGYVYELGSGFLCLTYKDHAFVWGLGLCEIWGLYIGIL